MDKATSDEELMNRYRDGDAASFEILYERHKGPLYRYFLRQSGIAALAEELYQDVWLKVIQSRERYQVRAKFTTYLYHLAHNRLTDHYRAQAARLPLSYDDDPDEKIEQVADAEIHEPENEIDRRRQVQRLLKLIHELPEAQRETFLLREEGDLSLLEIAEITGVTAETAKSRLRYALAKLRQGLAKDES
ncbi:MAG: RNA polymerase sigma factor [Sulfuricaulis sp.]|nr:RNA polymerase sigma factor [Sulfuricaulis sp.]